LTNRKSICGFRFYIFFSTIIVFFIVGIIVQIIHLFRILEKFNQIIEWRLDEDIENVCNNISENCINKNALELKNRKIYKLLFFSTKRFEIVLNTILNVVNSKLSLVVKSL
jgi:hypothetical protein